MMWHSPYTASAVCQADGDLQHLTIVRESSARNANPVGIGLVETVAMSSTFIKIMAVCGMIGGTVVPASAASISFGPTSASGTGPTIVFDELVAPTTIVGDATFTFTVNGDLNGSNEFVEIDVDGFSLGLVFNEDLTDDPFDFAGDEGANVQDQTGSATISNADFAGLIADGLLDVTFDFSQAVNNSGTIRNLEGVIEFTEADMNVVPLPASLPFLVTGFAGLLLMRRRRRT